MVSMKEIAKQCNVSVATVSKALNGYSDIGEETKNYILRTASEMGYLPNSSARALKTKRTFNLGVLFVDEARSGLTHDYFNRVLESFKSTAEAKGYDITFTSGNVSGKRMTYLEHCRYRGVDGVVMACVDFTAEEVQELLLSDIPVVTIDHICDGRISVVSNNIQGMEELVTYIYKKGHRKIAYIHGDDTSVTKNRLGSFYRTLQRLGIEEPDEYVKPSFYRDADLAGERTGELLDLKDPPTCILYPDDYAAMGGINEIRERGLRIPEDISVAGYDGINIAQVLEPKLTTLCQDTAAIGRIAAERLIELIEHPKTTVIEKYTVDGPFKEAYPDDYERIVFVNTGGSDYYQSKLDPVLDDPSNELYPDMMGLEVDYVQKYVNSDWVQNVADLGITADDYANSYQYNLDLGSDVDGNVRALFWQATPGCYAVRADLAEKYLGTTDPAALAEKFKDLDTIVATAKEVNDASGGKCKLFSGYDEIKRSLTGSRTQGFYDENDKITIDDNIKTYMETAKTLYDEDLTFNTDQWSADWSANMSGDGVDSNAALAYMGCPWFVYWSLSDAWKGNTILVPTQTKCYWGGTGLAATTDCADTELAAKIMKFFTCDEDGMVAINALNSDYVNNTAAVSKIIEAGTSADGNGYLYPDAGQNFMEFFLPLADGLDASMVTAEDQQILSLMDTQTKAYATGEKDLDTALADLTASIHDTFSYLSAE